MCVPGDRLGFSRVKIEFLFELPRSRWISCTRVDLAVGRRFTFLTSVYPLSSRLAVNVSRATSARPASEIRRADESYGNCRFLSIGEKSLCGGKSVLALTRVRREQTENRRSRTNSYDVLRDFFRERPSAAEPIFVFVQHVWNSRFAPESVPPWRIFRSPNRS